MKKSPTSPAPTGRSLASKLVAEMQQCPGIWFDLELDEVVELLDLPPRSYPRNDLSTELFNVFNSVCPRTRDGRGVSTTYDPVTKTNRVRYMDPSTRDLSLKS